jgi:hypothetical protein
MKSMSGGPIGDSWRQSRRIRESYQWPPPLMEGSASLFRPFQGLFASHPGVLSDMINGAATKVRHRLSAPHGVDCPLTTKLLSTAKKRVTCPLLLTVYKR